MLGRIIKLFAAEKKNKGKLSLSSKVEPIEVKSDLQDLVITIEAQDRKHFERLKEKIFKELYLKPQSKYIENLIADHLKKQRKYAFLQPKTLSINSNVKFEVTLDFSSELHRIVSKTQINDSDVERIKELLEMKSLCCKQGYECNPDRHGNIPLYTAILSKNLLAIKLLIVYGASLFLKNRYGKTPYQLASVNSLVQDLFHNDLEVNKEVRRQKLNYHMNNMKKLFSKEEQKVELK